MAMESAALDTRSRLLAAARQLLDAGGAEAVTMRRVASACDITAMAVYRHFADRSALLSALANQGFAELAAELAALTTAGALTRRLTALIDTFLDQALDNPRLFELMFLQPRQGARKYPRDWHEGNSPTANAWADVLRDGMAAGELAQGDIWELVFIPGAMLQGLLMLYIGGRTELSRQQFRNLCHQSLRKYYGLSR